MDQKYYKGTTWCLGALAANTPSKLDVIRHNRDALGMDRAQVSVFEETNEVRLGGFLEGQHSQSLEAEVTLEVLGDLADETLEGQLADEEVGRLLIPTDLSEGNSSGMVTVGLLDATGVRGGLAGSINGKLLVRSFSSGRFAGGLLGVGHC